MIALFFTALFAPLAAALFSLLQKQRAGYVSVFALSLSSTILVYLLFKKPELSWSVPWFSIGSHPVSASVLLNDKSLAMSALISVLSLLIHIYSIDYLKKDEKIISFFGNLGLFTFSMLGIAVSGNLLLTFFFWELVGFSSYRLIGHWYTRPAAAYAATQSFLINRLADMGFVMALALLWKDNGSLDYSILLANEQSAWVFVLLFIGLMGKSAQLPFSGWLLNAMEGPTPASALIHSATMVAAGVYLLVILNPATPPMTQEVILAVGSLTCLLAGLGALLNFDLKKILAYSTISQLGLMMTGIGANIPEESFFHLFTHAFIKAGLFLAAGILIHSYHHQDIRKMGGLQKKSPLLFYALGISLASLAGIPFTAGFASKEIILVRVLVFHSTYFILIVALINLLAVAITALYCTRLLLLFTRKNEGLHEKLPFKLAFSFFACMILSYVALCFFPASGIFSFHPSAFISLVAVVAGIALGFLLYRSRRFDRGKNPDFIFEKFYHSTAVIPAHFMAKHTLFFDQLIDTLIHLTVYLKVAFASLIGWLDKNLVDGLVTLFVKILSLLGQLIRSTIKGQVQSYIAWSLAFVLLLILCTIFS